MVGANRPFTRLGLVIPARRSGPPAGSVHGSRTALALTAAVAAERAGFDMVWIDDGPAAPDARAAGPVEDPTPLDAYALLGACAARTSTIGLGALSTPVTARRPAVLAKVVTTLDVISRGRAVLGIGAGDPGARAAERLAEGVAICRGLLAGEEPSMTGAFFHVVGAPNRPGPVRAGGIPIVVDATGLPAGDVVTTVAALAEGPPPWPAGLVVRDGATTTARLTAELGGAGAATGRRDVGVTTIRVLRPDTGSLAPGVVAAELGSAVSAGFDALAVPFGALIDGDAGDEEVVRAVGAAGAAGAAAAGTVRAC